MIGNDILYVAGLRAKVTAGGAWLKGEFDKDFGSNRTVSAGGVPTFNGNYTGWAGKVDLGYKADLANLGALTGWAQGGIGSGGATANRNFQSIAGDYRPGSIWGRFAAAWSARLSPAARSPTTNTLSNLVVLGRRQGDSGGAEQADGGTVQGYNFRRQNRQRRPAGSNRRGSNATWATSTTWTCPGRTPRT